MRSALAGLLLPLAFALPATAHMQTPQNGAEVPVAVGTSTATPPAVDGRLDDAVWESAPVITDFVQHEPFEGRPATERT